MKLLKFNMAAFVSIMLLASLMVACKSDTKTTTAKKQKVMVIKKAPQILDLFYKGSIAPIKYYNMVSPVDGRIATVDFQYGDSIHQNQKLISINAESLVEDFQKNLTDYFTKKNQLSSSHQEYLDDLALYHAGVETKFNLQTALSTYNSNKINLATAKKALEKQAKSLGIQVSGLEKLSLTDVSAIEKSLNQKVPDIVVNSNYSGVAIHPLADSNKNDDDSADQPLKVGNDLKKYQLVLTVGDLSGYAVKFNVSEINVKDVKVGQAVIVTGPAFIGVKLHGYVTSVASQANPGDPAGGLAQFAVEAKVPQVNTKLQQVIAIGMSAKIDLPIKTVSSITIPITAIGISNKKQVVKCQQANGEVNIVPVTVGQTVGDNIIVLTGLKVGDKVQYPYD